MTMRLAVAGTSISQLQLNLTALVIFHDQLPTTCNQLCAHDDLADDKTSHTVTGFAAPTVTGCAVCCFVDSRLTNLSLAGALPPSWGRLTSLQTISLYNNQLGRALPDSWGALTSLSAL
jgi:hypothetical protein